MNRTHGWPPCPGEGIMNTHHEVASGRGATDLVQAGFAAVLLHAQDLVEGGHSLCQPGATALGRRHWGATRPGEGNANAQRNRLQAGHKRPHTSRPALHSACVETHSIMEITRTNGDKTRFKTKFRAVYEHFFAADTVYQVHTRTTHHAPNG